MDKHIKAIGLAVLALPVALALAGLMQEFGILESSKPWSWAILKWIVSMVCGAAYFLGLYLFNQNDPAMKPDDET